MGSFFRDISSKWNHKSLFIFLRRKPLKHKHPLLLIPKKFEQNFDENIMKNAWGKQEETKNIQNKKEEFLKENQRKKRKSPWKLSKMIENMEEQL